MKMKTLEYYFVKKGVIEHVIFNKYTIDENGVIKNKKTGKAMAQTKSKDGYKRCSVYSDMEGRRIINICRAISSTFLGPSPTPEHTADHMDKNRINDTVDNIQWLCKSGQANNRNQPKTFKSAFIIVKDGLEKTANGWAEYLKEDAKMILYYAQRNQYGFSYKKYDDLPGEIWKEINESKNGRGGYWKISNMNRVKYITKIAENVFSGDRLGLSNGYPKIIINGINWKCHILSFMTFFPEDYARRKTNEIILHEDDNRNDFRPHKLRLGTQSENITDAHANGCNDGTKSSRMKCASYINDVFEKEHESQHDAMRYLRSNGYLKASVCKVGVALAAYRKGETRVRYGRTWKLV